MLCSKTYAGSSLKHHSWWKTAISKSSSSPKNLNELKFEKFAQALQKVDEFVSKIRIYLEKCSIKSLAHFEFSAVNGCRQNESPNS